MTTFLSLLSSILPGARSVRAPFFAGILWTIFFWLLLGDVSPATAEQVQLQGQVVDFAGYLGSLPTLALGSMLVFTLGAAATFASTTASQSIGRLIAWVSRRFEWQWHAQLTRTALKKTVKQTSRTIKLDAQIRKASAISADQQTEIHAELAEARRANSAAQAKLNDLIPIGMQKRPVWIPHNALTVKALGAPTDTDETAVAERIIENTYNNAAVEYATKMKFIGGPKRVYPDGNHQYELLEELKPEPLEALKALDNDLFVEIDRERSERELRVAIAAPLIAMSILGVIQYTEWLWIGVAVSVALLVAHSVSPARERSRVMKLISLRGKETPAMRSAATEAKQSVIESMVERHHRFPAGAEETPE